MESGLYCCSNNLDSLVYPACCLLVDPIHCFTFSQLSSNIPNYPQSPFNVQVSACSPLLQRASLHSAGLAQWPVQVGCFFGRLGSWMDNCYTLLQ